MPPAGQLDSSSRLEAGQGTHGSNRGRGDDGEAKGRDEYANTNRQPISLKQAKSQNCDCDARHKMAEWYGKRDNNCEHKANQTDWEKLPNWPA